MAKMITAACQLESKEEYDFSHLAEEEMVQ